MNQDSKLAKLDAALDGTAWGRPEADILLLYLGGNDMNFALNEGLLTVPFTMPLTDYPAGFFDAPGVAPAYSPFPGGARRADVDPVAIPREILPGPPPALDDGIHPSATGWSTLLSWTWDQGLEQLVADGTWAL